MKSIQVIRLFVVFAFAASALAFMAPPSSFKVDNKASQIVWIGRKVTGEHSGTVPVASGELQVDGNAIVGGSFEIDLASLTVTDIKDAEGNANLVGHLKSNDFFATANFPKAQFKITSVSLKSGSEYLVRGDLSIKGKTNAIEFPAVIQRSGKQITATAQVLVDRTKYDIRYGSKTFFESIGDKAISDEFELNVKLVASQQ